MTDAKVYAMPSRPTRELNNRSLGSIVSAIRDELKSFLNTRDQMMKSEFHEALGAIRVALPFALVLAHHKFMTILVKLFNHIGQLLALLKINVITEPYVTD